MRELESHLHQYAENSPESLVFAGPKGGPYEELDSAGHGGNLKYWLWGCRA